jgi:hypothetical protein
MVHACGLSNEEHSRSGDSFMASPTVLNGDKQADDVVDSGRTDATKARVGMPPMLLNDDTAGKIQRSWRGPSAPSPNPVAPTSAGRSVSAQRGPAGLTTGSITLAGARRQGPLTLRSVDGLIRHVWS